MSSNVTHPSLLSEIRHSLACRVNGKGKVKPYTTYYYITETETDVEIETRIETETETESHPETEYHPETETESHPETDTESRTVFCINSSPCQCISIRFQYDR